MNTSIGIPEGFVILAILIIFPSLLAYDKRFNVEKTIHSYMYSSQIYIQRFINTLYNNIDMEQIQYCDKCAKISVGNRCDFCHEEIKENDN